MEPSFPYDLWVRPVTIGGRRFDLCCLRDFEATVSAETSFGSVRIDHPGLPAESKGSSKRYTGVLGKGGQPLTLKAGSGSITLTALDG